MSDSPATSDPSPSGRPAATASSPGVLASLGFWIGLLLAAASYALATLSSGLIENQRLAAQHAAGESELRQLAEQVTRYERYCKLLESRTERPSDPPAGLLEMSLEGSLQFHLDSVRQRPASPPSAAQIPVVISAVGRSGTLRRILLGGSVLLLIIAFVLCFEIPPIASIVPRPSTWRHSLTRRLKQTASRYRPLTDDAP